MIGDGCQAAELLLARFPDAVEAQHPDHQAEQSPAVCRRCNIRPTGWEQFLGSAEVQHQGRRSEQLVRPECLGLMVDHDLVVLENLGLGLEVTTVGAPQQAFPVVSL
ncbi:hypothetical protein HAX54_038482 [Datura stramonium]|uniref:Uncharacterized protein n=1 Tax=Datura stramonium TaxID=4076 RepID=A0ABS8VLB3_DATST|nr:hypothetical protein [Datura stramonium]